jgi:rhodanese-related sulfurtransferase
MASIVSEVPAASPAEALARFQARFRFETDCSDVHEALATHPDFVLVDARSAGAYARGHVPGAVNIPHRTIGTETMRAYPAGTLFVVYCAGPHCNGAARAAVRMASLGFAVKEMFGGITGWRDEGFALEEGAAPWESGPAKIACGC